jgi:hypothetical protein
VVPLAAEAEARGPYAQIVTGAKRVGDCRGDLVDAVGRWPGCRRADGAVNMFSLGMVAGQLYFRS